MNPAFLERLGGGHHEDRVEKVTKCLRAKEETFHLPLGLIGYNPI